MAVGLDIPGYLEVEQIGAGGFGRVFRARQPAFDRVVAIKVLNGKLDDAATLRRFRRECQALGAVSSHPNIVPVFDAGETPDGAPYLVMAYISGGSLADRLDRSGPLPWPEVAAMGVKLAGALADAHAAGVLHRDIKPENVLVSGYGEPQLADFGIAQRAGIENRTTTASAMTPSHTAPEQFAGSPPSERADVYALASTLFSLLAGASPFQGRPGESVFALMARVATEPPPDLRPRGVPDALARVMEAGLAKDPAARPATAIDFGRMLQDAQRALGQQVTPLPVAQEDPPSRAALPPYGTPPPRATPPPYGAPFEHGSPIERGTPPPAVPVPGPPPRRRPGRMLALVAGVVTLVVAATAVTLAATRGSGPTAAPASSTALPPRSANAAGGDAPAELTPADGAPSDPATGSSSGNDLQAVLLKPGEAPLVGWSDAATSLLGGLTADRTDYFCDRTVELGDGEHASTMMTDGAATRLLDHDVYQVGPDRAAKAMAQLRDSTSCGSWKSEAGQLTVTAGPKVAVGDEAATYTTSGAGVPVQTYQVFFHRGAYFSVVTVVSISGALTAADRALAAKAAQAAARRLPG